MDLVADTNIFLAVALDEPEKTEIIRLTTGADIIAPEILPYEIGNGLTTMCKRRQITPEQALIVHQITNRIPVRLMTVNIRRALDIAFEFNLYAYDAYFLQCARSMSCPLITLDRQMIQVAVDLGIDILE